MAKVCSVNRNLKREQLSASHADKRAALKAKVKNEELSYEERMNARDELNKLPRDGAKIRVRNRCAITGRPRGVYRKFNLCRITLREMASSGELPGVTKSSW